jgi:hypothetical protein
LQDTLFREELLLSGILGLGSTFIYGIANFVLLHPERLPVSSSLALFSLMHTLGLAMLLIVLMLLIWNVVSYVLRIPIMVGLLRLTGQSRHDIRDLLAISVRPYTKGYARFTRSERARLQ